MELCCCGSLTFVGPLSITSALCIMLFSIDLYSAYCGDHLHVNNFSSLQTRFFSSIILYILEMFFCLPILGIPVTRFKQGYKTTNLNKYITAHANLLVYHVVSVSSLALGWYEANKYLLLSLLAPVTLGTASPFCDFGMLIMFGELNFLYSNPCS